MGVEIERKFLVRNDAWRKLARDKGIPIRQGYLTVAQRATVRVRRIGDEARITIKGNVTGLRRSEFEYSVPVADADQMLEQLCRKPIIDKVRYRIPAGGLVWEIDDFFGENAGLVVAEIELKSENDKFDSPPWLGPEVTGMKRYYNSSLALHPFSKWPPADRLQSQD
jgi:adenylate cyclase